MYSLCILLHVYVLEKCSFACIHFFFIKVNRIVLLCWSFVCFLSDPFPEFFLLVSVSHTRAWPVQSSFPTYPWLLVGFWRKHWCEIRGKEEGRGWCIPPCPPPFPYQLLPHGNLDSGCITAVWLAPPGWPWLLSSCNNPLTSFSFIPPTHESQWGKFCLQRS